MEDKVMHRLLIQSITITMATLGMCLVVTAQTQPAAGKFGLPTGKQGTTTSTTPVASGAAANPTPAAPAVQPPAAKIGTASLARGNNPAASNGCVATVAYYDQ